MRWMILPSVLMAALAAAGEQQDAPSHGRPFFMPAAELARLSSLVQAEPWAKEEFARAQAAAAKGSGYWAAFLYALDGDAAHIPTVAKWLLKIYGPDAYWVKRYRHRLADPKFFEGGQPHLADVYYHLDITGLVAYDWAYAGLDPKDRELIEDGILACARYRIRSMDRWSQTPNLVFKPTYMVAMTGLATQDRECLDWGFRRKSRGGVHSGTGGYFDVLRAMLRDGGAWHEAPIYPIAHRDLWCMGLLSHWRSLYDGRDWFVHRTPSGASPKGLMDYYIDTAYPIERTGHGPGQIRIATYGDGATDAKGRDLFLVNPAGRKCLKVHEALAAAYRATGDPRYAPFVAMIPGYKPDLVEHRPLPANVELPPAPSKVWPTYGLAMLRSDESPAYWTSGKAIAVFQLMSQGYGHDHRDKLGIMLHGAGRLFYPDYNPIQYENPAIGWSRNSPCHNTLIVDEQDTRNATPTGIRHDFAPEVKFLATSVSGVFEGVEQTRALLLTREYLLDLFHVSSRLRHTYDYVLHSFGQVRPAEPDRFEPSEALVRRYWLMERQRAMETDDAWSLDFVIAEQPGSREGNYGKAWYDHRATLRLTMAGDPHTLVSHGVDVHGVPMVVARRGRRDTVFAATHEPVAAPAEPQIRRVTKLVETAEAIVVRVDAASFSDYAAVAFGPQKEPREHVLGDGASSFCFRSYGYLRVVGGRVVARRGLTGFRVPGAQGDAVVFGDMAPVTTPPRSHGVECPFPVTTSPRVIRVFERDRRPLTFRIANGLKVAVSGRIEIEAPEGWSFEPAAPTFGPIAAGESGEAQAMAVANKPKAGIHTIPYRIVYRPAEGEREVRTLPLALAATVGPTLESTYRHPKPNVYVLHAPKLTAKLHMFHGLVLYLADDDDVVRLDGKPLFTFSDGEKPMLGEDTKHATTWPHAAPAHLTAHAYDRCRWQAVSLGDRIMFRMDRDWTQFERAHFSVPGHWISPGGAPQWRRIIALDAQGNETDAQPGAAVKVAAAELAFPGAKWHLAFQFQPAQTVAFNGAGMAFQLRCFTGDKWVVGFCKPGALDAWRWKK